MKIELGVNISDIENVRVLASAGCLEEESREWHLCITFAISLLTEASPYREYDCSMKELVDVERTGLSPLSELSPW